MRAFVLAVALAFGGCGERPGPPIFDAGPRLDAGRGTDAGRRPDGALPDAEDAGRGDAGDAGALACATSPDLVYKLGGDQGGTDRVIGLAAGGGTFAAVWAENREGRPGLYGVRMSSDGALGLEQSITDNTAREHTPSVAAVGSSWLAAWVDNEGSSGFEVRVVPLNADVGPSGTVHDITATDTLVEEVPTIMSGSAGILLAWLEQDTVAGDRVMRARALGLDGTPSGAAADVSSSGTTPLVLGELSGGPVVLWTEGGHLVMQPLTAAGSMRGASIVIDEGGNVSGPADAALFPSGGAVVFGVTVGGLRREVRFRALGPDGGRLGDERILGEGTDASIATFAGGFVVSYRAPADEGSELRVWFVDASGEVVGELPVTEAASEGGRTTVRVSGDGQIAIAWGDRTSSSLDVRLAAIRCGVGP